MISQRRQAYSIGEEVKIIAAVGQINPEYVGRQGVVRSHNADFSDHSGMGHEVELDSGSKIWTTPQELISINSPS